ncbi:MAG: elongation factor P [Ardenticatenales bacterium]|jgi:elongation factor P|nr:elongation factor P [Ardenticatenales bacterium]
MIEAAQLRRGMVVDLDGALYECIDQSLIKMGRGGATVKAKIRNLDSGAQFERSFNSNERLQDIRLENRRVQYLYTDGDLFHFMDLESYEQPVIPRDQIGDAAPWLIENMELQLAMHEGKAIRIELPTTIDIEVAEAPPGFKGDTSSGGTKPVKLANGLMVNVPFFVETGSILRIDTRTGAYVTRVKGA